MYKTKARIDIRAFFMPKSKKSGYHSANKSLPQGKRIMWFLKFF